MQKTRGEGILPVVFYVTRNNCGVITNAGTRTRYSAGWYESSVGQAIPDFFRFREQAARRGELIPMTAWAQSYQTVMGEENQVVYLKTRPCDVYTLKTQGVPSVVMPSNTAGGAHPDNRELLIQEAIAALYKEGWDAGTFFAQFNQSVKTFEQLVKRIIKLFKTGKLSMKDIGNPISEIAWAWRPMLYDIQDLAKLVQSLGDVKTGKAFRKRANASSTWVDSTSSDWVSANYTLRETLEWTTTYEERVTVHSMIAPPRVLFDPLVTAWESVPFSFVLDKLINIGALLASLSGRMWHQDLQLAYGTHITVTCNRKYFMVKSGTWDGVVDDDQTWIRIDTSRQPLNPTSYLPQLAATPLKATNLIYWVELIRKLRR